MEQTTREYIENTKCDRIVGSIEHPLEPENFSFSFPVKSADEITIPVINHYKQVKPFPKGTYEFHPYFVDGMLADIDIYPLFKQWCKPNEEIEPIDVEVNYKPKRLPRKLKKAYRNGKVWAIEKVMQKNPSYVFQNCTICADIADGMSQTYKIKFDTFEKKIVAYEDI